MGRSAVGLGARRLLIAVRRCGRVFALAVPMLMAPLPAAAAAATDWDRFLQRHLDPVGRIVDDGTGGASHSEGQGVGMLLAVHYQDRKTFDLLWQWTQKNLMVRDDGLLAWRWLPATGIEDRNNATDGDLLVAWALVRAGARWNAPEYVFAGGSLAKAVREKLVRATGAGLVLLPGATGFEPEGVPLLNLSYWVFPAFAEFERIDRSPAWGELTRSGHRLLAEARFGRWSLPPDWLRYDGRPAVAEDRPARFGYDAIRIPLYLLWSGTTPEEMRPFRAFWSHFRGASFLPAWTNLLDDSVDSHDTLKGVRALASVVTAYPHVHRIRLPELDVKQPYYSNALLLLTKVMLWETARR